MYISIGFLTYVLASCIALLGIGLLVLLISKKENRKSKLYRSVICFSGVIFSYCALYFMFFFRDMVLHYYSVGTLLRCVDYILDGGIAFFWLRTIAYIYERYEGRSMKGIIIWAWICGIMRSVTDAKDIDPLEITAIQHKLTDRELDVMRLVYEGKNNPEIAEALFISRNTVKKHLQNIYEKTGVNSRMELVYVINMSSGENHS